MEPETTDVENPQSIHIAKNEKACSEEITTGVAGQSLHREIVPQPAQKKPGIEMGLYQETHCQLGLKETDNGQKEGRKAFELLGFYRMEQ